tara:strand:+ start:1009 stop:1398 length:390 start_codon:yes stop_codon:yes gene_type:complete
MIRVCKAAAVVVGVGILVILFCGAAPLSPQDADRPVIPKLAGFRGDIFDGFTELRLQGITVDEFGIIAFDGEPFEALVNINYITIVHRYEDFKETDYSCMIYFKDKEIPFLVRQEYKEVLSSIRRASGK